MKTTTRLTPKTRFHASGLLTAIIVTVIASAFTLVWVEQQISRTAAQKQEKEERLKEVRRKIGILDERIAKMHQPQFLHARIDGKLRPSKDYQVVWVDERDIPDAAAHASRGEPYESTIDLAFVEFEARP
ncbi:MAG: hypothetical protein ACLFUF_00050 [Opitutales bacterium]